MFPLLRSSKGFPSKNKSAFTLTELIVVITILSILSVIGFSVMSHQSSVARDGKRISDIKTLSESARITSAQLRKLPTPIADSISLTVSGSFIGYQGFMSLALVNPLGYGSDKIFDPKDNIPYTYRVNQHYDQAQFLAYLENPRFERTIEIAKQSLPSTLPDTLFASDSLLVSKAYALDTSSIDLSKRYPYSAGDRLGIFLSKGSKQPLQNGVSGTGSRDISLSDASMLDIIVGSQGADEYVSTDISTGSLNALKSGTFDEKSLLGMNSGTGSGGSSTGSNSGGGNNLPWTYQTYVGGAFGGNIIENGVTNVWGQTMFSSFDQISDVLEVGTYCILKNDHSTRCIYGYSLPVPVEHLGSGGDGMCGVTSAGEISCLPLFSIPSGITDVRDVTMGALGFGCVLKNNGSVECFGDNTYGETDVPPGLTDVTSIAAAAGTVCALRSNGSLVCWGYAADSSGIQSINNVVQIQGIIFGFTVLQGDGTIKAVSTFGATPGITSSLNVGAVSIGGSCYKDVNDQIHCISSPTPAELAATNLTHVFALSDSSMPICYRSFDGHLSCDELVIGNSYQSPTSLEGVVSIVFSENGGHWCALKTNHTVACDALASWTTPPEGLTDVVKISASYQNFCALKSNHSLICWGDRDITPSSVQTGVIDIAGSYSTNCAVKDNTSIECWHPDESSGLVDVVDGNNFIKVAMGGSHACGIKTDGTTSCWEHGGGYVYDINPPPEVNDIADMAISDRFACALSNSGDVSCWKDQGPSTTLDVTPPTELLHGVQSIATSANSICAVKNGKVGCWGDWYRKYPE